VALAACCFAASSFTPSRPPRSRRRQGSLITALSLFAFSITQVVNATLRFQRLDLANVLPPLTLHTSVLAIVPPAAAYRCRLRRGERARSVGLARIRVLRRQLRGLDDRGRSTPVTWRSCSSSAAPVGSRRHRPAQAGKVLPGTLGSLVWVTR
jgi:hypothetical protein